MGTTELKNRDQEIERLVLKIQQGDHDAFARLYDIFIDPIYRYVYYRVNQNDAEDLTEVVFLKVWENILQYKKQKSTFAAWIFRIAHNLVVDHYRATKDRAPDELSPNLPDTDRQHNPVRSAQDTLDKQILKKAMVNLKKQYQEIIIYKFVNDFSNQEIAEILNKSEGSLRILQFRALKALKKELIDMGVKYEF